TILKMSAFAALFVILAVGCGKKDDPAPVVGVAPVTSCQAGYGYYNNTCMAQGGCQVGYVNYNNSCVPAQIQGGVGSVSATCQAGCQAGYAMTAIGCLPINFAACGQGVCAGLSGSYCYPGHQ
ncbi:MAG: hypothetical protein ACXVBE_10410, partial [Bdellovibrionota bacterium]